MSLIVGTRRALLPSRYWGVMSGILDRVPGFTFGYALNAVLKGSAAGSAKVNLREDAADTLNTFYVRDYDADGIGGTLRDLSGQTVAEWLTAESATNAHVRILLDDFGDYPLTQGTNAAQPIISTDGKKITWDGGDALNATASIELDPANPFTIAWVCKTDSPVVSQYPHIVSFKQTGNDLRSWQLFVSNEISYKDVSFGADGSNWLRVRCDDIPMVAGDSSYRAGILRYNGEGATTLGNYSLRIDGVAGTLTAPGILIAGDFGSNHAMGSKIEGGQQYEGDLPLLLYGASHIEGAALATLEAWLADYVSSLA